MVVFSLDVVGKFTLQQQGNSDEIILVYQESENSSIAVIQQCEEVIFDSIMGMIYIQSRLNKFNNEYSSIKILEQSASQKKPYILQSIRKDIYEKNTKGAKVIYFK